MPEIKVLILPQLDTIAHAISKTPEGYQKILEVVLPVVHRLLVDQAAEVSEKAATSLANLAELLRPEDRGNHVLTIVLSNTFVLI